MAMAEMTNEWLKHTGLVMTATQLVKILVKKPEVTELIFLSTPVKTQMS